MEANKRPLNADAGALYELAATWLENGTAVDLSEWDSGQLVVTTRSETAEPLATADAEMDDQGNIVVSIPADELPDPGLYSYRLQVRELHADDWRFLLVGPFKVRGAADV